MDLKTLSQLADLQYQKSLFGLSELLKREARLRADIETLRARAHEAQTLPVAPHSMRNIGADVIWLRWVSKTIGALNIELAQVLAQKEAYLAAQRRALGRREVASDLAARAVRTEKEKSDARKMANALETHLINQGFGAGPRQSKDIRP